MTKVNADPDVDIAVVLDDVLSNEASEWYPFVVDDLPDVKFPPSSWLPVVINLLEDRWQSMDVDVMTACVEFVAQQEKDGSRKGVFIRLLLERTPCVHAVLIALDVLPTLEEESKHSVESAVKRAYESMPGWRKTILNLDSRFRALHLRKFRVRV